MAKPPSYFERYYSVEPRTAEQVDRRHDRHRAFCFTGTGTGKMMSSVLGNRWMKAPSEPMMAPEAPTVYRLAQHKLVFMARESGTQQQTVDLPKLDRVIGHLGKAAASP